MQLVDMSRVITIIIVIIIKCIDAGANVIFYIDMFVSIEIRRFEGYRCGVDIAGVEIQVLRFR